MKVSSWIRTSFLEISCIVFALSIIGFSPLIGQVQFQKTYSPPLGGSANESWGYCVQETMDGGYIVAGRSNRTGLAFRDAVLIKTDVNGAVQWTFDYSRLLSTAFIQEARYVIEVDDYPMDGQPDGYVFVGWVQNLDQVGVTDKDVFAVKVDLAGGLLWSTLVGDPNNDYDEQAFAVRQDPNDGNYVLTGGVEMLMSGSALESRLLVMKLDQATGTIVWDHAYGLPTATFEGSHSQGYSLDLWDWDRDQVDDGWVVTGWAAEDYSVDGVYTAEDFYLVGIDWTGVPFGLFRIGVSAGLSPLDFSTEYGLSVIQRESGTVVIAGEYTPSVNEPVSGRHPTMLSLPSDFHRNPSVNWMRYYTGSNITMEAAYCVRQEPYGLIVASGGGVGQMYDINSDPMPLVGSTVMFKTNSTGSAVNWGWNYQATATQPTANLGNGHSVRFVSDGFVMTGVDQSFGPARAVHLVKTDYFGSTRCDELPLDISIETVQPYMFEHGERLDLELENIVPDVETDEDMVESIHCFSPKRIPFISPSTGEGLGALLSSYPNPVQAGQDIFLPAGSSNRCCCNSRCE